MQNNKSEARIVNNSSDGKYKIEYFDNEDDEIKILCFLDTEKGKLHIKYLKKLPNRGKAHHHEASNSIAIFSFPTDF